MKKLMKKLATSILIAGVLCIPASVTADAGQWKQNDTGKWYQNDDGSYPKDQWFQEGDKWYYFDIDGYMKTGWVETSGKWYYLGKNGIMNTNTITLDGYPVATDGSWITQTVKISEIEKLFFENQNSYVSEYTTMVDSDSVKRFENGVKKLKNILSPEPIKGVVTIRYDDDFLFQLEEVVNSMVAIDFAPYYNSNNNTVKYTGTAYEIFRVSMLHYGNNLINALVYKGRPPLLFYSPPTIPESYKMINHVVSELEESLEEFMESMAEVEKAAGNAGITVNYSIKYYN